MTEKGPINGFSGPEDMVTRLGLTIDEAASLWRSWSYESPKEPEAYLAHARAACGYEYEMRGLNADLSSRRINRKKYNQEEATLNKKYFG